MTLPRKVVDLNSKIGNFVFLLSLTTGLFPPSYCFTDTNQKATSVLVDTNVACESGNESFI